MRLQIYLFSVVIFFLSVCVNNVFANNSRLKVAMVLWRGETAAERGFRDGLKSYGHRATIDVFNAEQNKSKVGSILRKKIKQKDYDYVYTFGTTVSLLTKSYLNGEVPHIFNIVADPVGAGLATSLKSSGGNLCGVKSGIPLNLQIETAHQLLKFKRLGYIFNSREKNSNLTLDTLEEISRDLKFKVIKLRSPPAQDRLGMNLRKIVDQSIMVDAVYLPSDSYIVSNAKEIALFLRRAGVPSVGAIKKYITEGALMGSVADYYELGREAASILNQHQKGRNFENMSIRTPSRPKLVLNETTMTFLGLELPDIILNEAAIIEK